MADVTSEEIADLLTQVAQANALVAAELDTVVGGHLAVSQALLDRLEAVIGRVRPAAAARARLSGLDPDVLLGGVAVWRRRALPGLADRGRQ